MYTLLPIFPPTNDEVLLHRIAQINHNTKVKFTKFPADDNKHVNYQLLLDALRACERLRMKKRVVELGPLPVFSPNFSSARGIAITSRVSVVIPTKEPYILGPQLRASAYVPELLRILSLIRPDLQIPGAKDLNQGQILMKKTSVKASKVVVPMVGGFNETGRIFVIGQSKCQKVGPLHENVNEHQGRGVQQD